MPCPFCPRTPAPPPPQPDWPMRVCPHLGEGEQEAAILVVDFHPTLKAELKNTYLRVCANCAGAMLGVCHAIEGGS